MSSSSLNKILENSVNHWKQAPLIYEEWLKMIDGRPVNFKKISGSLYESWQKSKNTGVNPFDATQVLYYDEYDELLELTQKYNKIIKKVSSVAKSYGYNLQFYDTAGRNFAPPNKKWLKEISNIPEIYSGDLIQFIDFEKMSVTRSSEETIGTSVLNFVFQNNQPFIISGPQHYNRCLHTINCSATPVHNVDGKVIGALNIITDIDKNPENSFLLITMLGQLFDLLLAVVEEKEQSWFDDDELSMILDQMQQGVIYTDNRNCIKFYNERVRDIFGIRNQTNANEELARCLALINCKKNYNKRKTSININGVSKFFTVSSQEISNGNITNRLILLTEEKQLSHDESMDNRTTYTFEDIIGQDNGIIQAKSLAEHVAVSDSSVIIMGESGTGKELFAHAIHNSSARSNQPFIAINCGAIPAELVESELFGYEPGSFTGALAKGKRGQIELASGGTLFLDEIESMPLYVQVKLLRTLSTKRILKVGGTKELPVDIRIISATKKDLLKEVDKGVFREDLYYRINTFIISLPALREHKEDIPLIANHFINYYCSKLGITDLSIHDDFLEALKHYSWRGNVRELKSIIERSIILLKDRRELCPTDLPEEIFAAHVFNCAKEKASPIESSNETPERLMQVVENEIINIVLKETAGNMNKAAKILGVNRQTLYNKIKDYSQFRNAKY